MVLKVGTHVHKTWIQLQCSVNRNQGFSQAIVKHRIHNLSGFGCPANTVSLSSMRAYFQRNFGNVCAIGVPAQRSGNVGPSKTRCTICSMKLLRSFSQMRALLARLHSALKTWVQNGMPIRNIFVQIVSFVKFRNTCAPDALVQVTQNDDSNSKQIT